jgi:hypothetical protein
MLPCIPLSVIFLAFSTVYSVARSHGQLTDHPQSSLNPRSSSLNVNPNGSSFLWLPQDEYSGKTFFECGSFFWNTSNSRITCSTLTAVFHSSITQIQPSESVLVLFHCSAEHSVTAVKSSEGCLPMIYALFSIATRSFVDQQTAFSKGLAYVQDDGVVIMKGDNTTVLSAGVYRDRHVIPALHARTQFWFKGNSSVRIQSQTQYNTGLFILDLNRAPWGCGTCAHQIWRETRWTTRLG